MPNKLIEQWPHWRLTEKPKVLKELNGGLNNRVWLLKADGQAMVLKHFLQPSNISITTQQLASDYRLSPTICYADPDNHYLLMDYVETEVPNSSNINLVKLADALKRLHTIPLQKGSPSRFDTDQHTTSYLRKIDNTDNKINKNLLTLQQQISPSLQAFKDEQTQYCLCHNDLVAQNILLGNNTVQFIDWEYAQLNNPWFDLASVIVYLALSKAQSLTLLSHYFERAIDPLPEVLSQAKCVVLWLDILWTLHKMGSSSWTDLFQKRQQLSAIASLIK